MRWRGRPSVGLASAWQHSSRLTSAWPDSPCFAFPWQESPRQRQSGGKKPRQRRSPGKRATATSIPWNACHAAVKSAERGPRQRRSRGAPRRAGRMVPSAALTDCNCPTLSSGSLNPACGRERSHIGACVERALRGPRSYRCRIPRRATLKRILVKFADTKRIRHLDGCLMGMACRPAHG